MSIAVLIPTFRRPQLLRKTLESLQVQTCSAFEIVVSDNDAEKTEGLLAASAWASDFSLTDRLHLTVAAERGLSQNRNNGLLLAFEKLGSDAVAMIDDDSEAHPDWVANMREALRHDAGLFGGPTIYRFPTGVPEHIRNVTVFGVPYDATGFVRRLRSSNNCMVTRAVYDRSGGRLFDPAFGTSGGEDTQLFFREKKIGTKAWWQSDAIVYEDVPLDRCTEQWIAERQRTTAVNAARIDRQVNGAGAAWIRQPYLAARELTAGLGKLMSGGDRVEASENFRSAYGRCQGLLGRLSLHDTSKRA